MRRWQSELSVACRDSQLPMPAGTQSAPPPISVVCYDCGLSFDTSAAWAHHRRRTHGVHKPARRYARDGLCRACGMDFYSRQRLIRHLNHSKQSCLDTLAIHLEPLTEHELVQLQRADKAERKSLKAKGITPLCALRPATQTDIA